MTEEKLISKVDIECEEILYRLTKIEKLTENGKVNHAEQVERGTEQKLNLNLLIGRTIKMMEEKIKEFNRLLMSTNRRGMTDLINYSNR